MKVVAVFLAAFIAMASSLGALDEFAKGNLQFTADLYKEILAEKPQQNFVFSPLSIEIIVALARAGAKGKTEAEITQALSLPNQKSTEEALRSLLPALRSNTEHLRLSTANRMFLGQNFQILDTFKSIATGAYQAGVDNLDFGKGFEAANFINQWVEDQTNNKIKNLIDPNSLSEATRLVLVNALYFSGKWETPFETYLTRNEKFYIGNGNTKEVPMMHVEDTFRYYDSAKHQAQYLELPYLGGNISMTIVLPYAKDGLPILESSIESVLEPVNLQYERVSVKLPRFLVESDLKLNDILKRLGMVTAFSDGADLSGISREALKIDEVIQKAFINVTESGTEAAAATAINAYRSAKEFLFPSNSKIFKADHPFIYAIKMKNVILFSGKIAV